MYSKYYLIRLSRAFLKRLKFTLIFVLFLFFVLFLSCRKEIVPEPYKPSSAHEAYGLSLQQANLVETALGKDWLNASEKALKDPIEISTPFEEIFYIDSTSAFAIGYQFFVKRGQRIEAEVLFQNRRSVRLFMDLYRVTGDSINEWIKVASANKNEKRLEFEPRRDAHYIIRLQSELLRGGRCKVVIRNVASIAFPIPTRNSKSILSFFGDPREGGRREHHGIDIFAPRHTPIIAPAQAAVRYVGNGGIGGHVIWLLDTNRNYYYYFAHLQTDRVEKNQIVKVGQIIGTVGNSGNARTTSPHLHFGIYVPGSGPVDPFHFINQINFVPVQITADQNALGAWVRSRPSKIKLRSLLVSQSKQTILIRRNTPMKVLAATKNLYRIRLPDGISAYVQAQEVEPIDKSIRRLSVSDKKVIRDKPVRNANTVKLIEPGTELHVLGQYKNFFYIKEQNGYTGWISLFTEPSQQTSILNSQESSWYK